MAWWVWALWVLAVVLAYEVVRSTLVGSLRAAQERRVNRFLRQHEIPSDPFRYTHRVVVKELVLADPQLVQAIADRARADGVGVVQVRMRVEAWLDEIVPQFNILAYYRVGDRLARFFAYSLYNVRVAKAAWQRVRAKIPENAAIVLVSNHRSNADFVVTGFMVSRSVQVSYAVGEWARVWPLESLFRSFGSYFVRRGEKDPLYHRTLESYLQLITKQGVTQAMFPEGGLSRDGRLRPVKLGLLDMMTRAKLDPAFDRPLVFVPVGINFDRVIEDEVLVAEHLGKHPYRRRGVGQKIARLGSLLGRTLVGLPIQLGRLLTKRLKKHGIAAIEFGDPMSFDEWYRDQVPFLNNADRHTRWEKLQPFADKLMAAIGQTVPATPATLTCRALQQIGAERMASGVDRGTILQAMRVILDESHAAGRPTVLDNPYGTVDEAAEEVEKIAASIDTTQLLEATLRLALDVLEKRGLLVNHEGTYKTLDGRWELVNYYGNALAPYDAPAC